MTLLRSASLAPNPNRKVPLAAVLTIETAAPAKGTITVANGSRSHDLAVPPSEDLHRALPVAGMRPGVAHRVTLKLTTQEGGIQESREFSFTPPELPQDLREMPPLEVRTCNPDAMEPGFLFLSVRRRNVVRALWLTERQKRFAQRWSMLVALDPDGEIVWTFHHDFRISGIARLPNGNLFFHQVNHHSFEIDLLGNVVRSWVAARRPAWPAPGAIPIDVQSLHHQPHLLPNGNFLAMAANTRVIENYRSSDSDPEAPRADKGVVGDKVIEFTPEGDVVWAWDSFEHLDVNRIGYHTFEPFWDTRGFPNHADWTHGNGVHHDPRDNGVLISLKHQDAVLKVDRAGKIQWILGHHKDWSAALQPRLLTPVGDLVWFWHGHNPRVTSKGTIIMYDNAILQAWPFDPPKPPAECFARAVEYEVDEERMEVRQVWTSAEADPVVSWAMGDAHRLPETDNRLVIDSLCLPEADPLDARGKVRKTDLTWNERVREEWHPSDFAYWVRVREYRRDTREVVFEARIEDPDGIMGWEVFGGAKSPSMGPLEQAA